MDNTKQQKISTPVAIIIAGLLIMGGILLTNGKSSIKDKTLSEQVGVNQVDFKQCLESTNIEELINKTNNSADLAMKNVPQEERGTPYSVIIGKNGYSTEVRGAYTIENMRKLIDNIMSQNVTELYNGEIPEITENDHIIGDINAPIVVVEYSDLECPYCKRFGEVMKELIEEYDGQVAWVYRHWVVHQGAIAKTAAAECVAKLKGEEAFWKYLDLVFDLMKTSEDATNEELNKL